MRNPVVNLYQLSVNVINVSVYTDGVLEDPSNFTRAEYLLAQLDDTAILQLSLNDGISIDGNQFVITIPATAITDDMLGTYQHQLILYNSLGEKLPPVFLDKVRIKNVLPITE